MKPIRNRTRDLAFYAVLLIIMVGVIVAMTRSEAPEKVKSYSELVDLFQQEKVKSFYTSPESTGTCCISSCVRTTRRSRRKRPMTSIISRSSMKTSMS